MAGIRINEASQVLSTDAIAEYLIPCGAGDGTAKAIKVKNLLKYASAILGIDQIGAFSPTVNYTRTTPYCTYLEKLYKCIVDSHLGPWNNNDFQETSIYSELAALWGSDIETVNVLVQSEDPEFVVEGIQVGLRVEDGTSVTDTTDENGECTFTIARGQRYVLSISDQEGYLHIPEKNLQATALTRNTYFNFIKDEQLDNYEQVSVKLIHAGNNVHLFDGLNVNVVIDGISGSNDYEVQNQWARFNVPKNNRYTITFPGVTNYRTSAPRTYNSLLDRRIALSELYLYTAPSGLTLITSDGESHTLADMIAMEDQDAAKASVVAIHVSTEILEQITSQQSLSGKCDFYIDVTRSWSSKQWKNSNTQFNCIPTISSASANPATAGNESVIDGLANTYLIKDEVEHSSGVTSAVIDYVSPMTLQIPGISGTMRGFCMAIRQFSELVANYEALNSIYNWLGKATPTIKSGNWWSSTQYSSTFMWYMGGGSPNGSGKAGSYTVLPVFA
jgi:hypothetical protein